MRSLAVLALGVLLGCGPATESHRCAITNGQLDTGHPAIAALRFALTGGTVRDGGCTATLVGTQTVITGAHCIPYDLTAFVVDGTVYDADKKTPHPGYDAQVSAYLNDIALVHLATAPPLTPMAISTSPPAAKTPITIVGLGETTKGAKDNNIKRIATNTIDEVKPLYFSFSGASGTEGNACYGDSGGPVLISPTGTEVLHGLMSYITGDCGPSTTYATRLDVFLQWLKTASGGDIQILDTVKPTVKIDEPQGGAAVASPVKVKVTASDDQGVASVELQVDGAAQGSLTQPPWDFSLPLGAGSHQLVAVAKDGAGNQTSSAAVSVTVLVPEAGAAFPDGTGPGDGGAQRDRGPSRPASSDCSMGRAPDADVADGTSLLCAIGWLVLLAVRRRSET